MNINEHGLTLNRVKNKTRQLKVIPVQRVLMAPPKNAPLKKDTNSAFTTNSSTKIRWRPNNSAHNSTAPKTTPSSRTRSSEPDSKIIVALSEGRGEAVGEVGIAAINIAQPRLILCQISDAHSYVNTLTKINILNPSEILIPLTFIESSVTNRLIEKVKEKFCQVKITGVTRSSFNKNTGLQYVKQLCLPSMNSILLVLQDRYYALTAAAALLTYIETSLYINYARESIKIEYQESEGCTIIDVTTADRLELVASARPATKKRVSCLLDILNHCSTKSGARTLRASILQPPCLQTEIEARLDCITELIEHPDMILVIQDILPKLTNIDKLLSLATVLPDHAHSCSERQLNYILLLNTILEQITPLYDVFENSKQPFFINLRKTLSDSAFAQIKELVRTLLHADAYQGKGHNGMVQRCFAIKSGINSLLDWVRKSYSERLDELRKYVANLGEKHGLALTLNNNYKKGYHIVLLLNAHQKKTLKKKDLPSEFVQIERLSTSYTMKTVELINLSVRIEDIMTEILKMSNIMIRKLLLQIREYVGVFYKLCEDIAKLDMLQSLAKASSAMHYVRPHFADYLELTHARHPLLDYLCSVEPTANSVYSSEEYNMHIITGPNGSGKSIFIRQVLLIQVMAQVGCYVPAQAATLRLCDRILARVYFEDNMDCGASAFVLEMKEIQYFLTVLTNNTLIIIDELCRSTSIEEGTALAMAVCEKLMQTRAFVFFTTHFKHLAKLRDLHFNVKTWQMETLTDIVNDQMILRFTYNVIPGVTTLEHYGIFLAKGSWPENTIKCAETILRSLTKSHKKSLLRIEQLSMAARLKYDLEADLKLLKTKKQLTETTIQQQLTEYEQNLQKLGYSSSISVNNPVYEEGPDYFNLKGHGIFGVSNKSCEYDIPTTLTNEPFFNYLPKAAQGFPVQSYNCENVSQNENSFLDTSDAISKRMEARLNNSENIFEPEVIIEIDGSEPFTRTENFNFKTIPPFHYVHYTNTYLTTSNNIGEESFQLFANVKACRADVEESLKYLAEDENDNLMPISGNAVENENQREQLQNFEEYGSSSSITERRFSIPLQQDVKRTSTPVVFPCQNSAPLDYQQQGKISLPSSDKTKLKTNSSDIQWKKMKTVYDPSNQVDVNTTEYSYLINNTRIEESKQSAYINQVEIFLENYGETDARTKSSSDDIQWRKLTSECKTSNPHEVDVNATEFSFALQNRNMWMSKQNSHLKEENKSTETLELKSKSSSRFSSNIQWKNAHATENLNSNPNLNLSRSKIVQETKKTNSSSSDGIKWKMREKPDKTNTPNQITNIFKIEINEKDSSKKCYSDIDINQIVDELQSYSEHFSTEWEDLVNENNEDKNENNEVENKTNEVYSNKEIPKMKKPKQKMEMRRLRKKGLTKINFKTKILENRPNVKLVRRKTNKKYTVRHETKNQRSEVQGDNNKDPTTEIKINFEDAEYQSNQEKRTALTTTRKDETERHQSNHGETDTDATIKYQVNFEEYRLSQEKTNSNTTECKVNIERNKEDRLNQEEIDSDTIEYRINFEENNENNYYHSKQESLNAKVARKHKLDLKRKEESVMCQQTAADTSRINIDKVEKSEKHQLNLEGFDTETHQKKAIEPQSNQVNIICDKLNSENKERNNSDIIDKQINSQSLKKKSSCDVKKSQNIFELTDEYDEELSFLKIDEETIVNSINRTDAKVATLLHSQTTHHTNIDQNINIINNKAEVLSSEKQENKMQKEESSSQTLNNSLEPLGDIHLELFSDQSCLEESQKLVESAVNVNTAISNPKQENKKIVSKSPCQVQISLTKNEFQIKHTTKLHENMSDEENILSESTESCVKRKRLGYLSHASTTSLNFGTPPYHSTPVEIKEPQNVQGSETLEFEPERPKRPRLKRKPNIRKPKTFKPPTKKQIEHCFFEQDRKMLESGDSAKYIETIMNRPSVTQIQQMKHIVSIQKTNTGVLIVPAKQSKPRKRKFMAPLKKGPEDFDITLLSDKNSDKFEKFLNTRAPTLQRQDVVNEIRESEVVTKDEHKGNSKVKILQNITILPAQKEYNFNIKEGYYSQNKNIIDGLVSKYLKPHITASNVAASVQDQDSSIFDNTTLDINANS